MYVQNQSRVDQTYLKEICVFKINFLGTWHILKQLVCLKSIYYGPVNEICVFKINLLWTRHILKQFVCWKSIYYGPDIIKKKKKRKAKLYGLFLWMGFNFLKARATSRRQVTFYHLVPKIFWYSFYQPQKDERLS